MAAAPGSGIVGWITVYWAAALVNMSFDVYLEGPQGGIVFWSIIGFGVATSVAIRNMEARTLVDEPIRP